MLDGIGDVEMLAVDAGRLERLVEQPSGGTHERSPSCLLVAGCSPTSITRACGSPAPNTVCVAFAQSGQSWQRRAPAEVVEGDLAIELECPA